MFTNDLIHETSPYLLQHAHNPVHWNAWNENTLTKARKENKILLISIGYAACHWCHVMEKESFENEEVANLMNENFICIKVDREERPDVDTIYMTAAQLINGNGGWPLNALAMPDGKPFYAGTYFPKDRWMQLLKYFAEQYHSNFEGIKKQAEYISEGIRKADILPPPDPHDSPFSIRKIKTVFSGLIGQTDKKEGGLTGNIKFPMPSVWKSLLVYHHLTGDKESLDITELTLQKMVAGGMYDPLGGGFARYSTDQNWHVPHFEKMLYDNAQLISLYIHAWQITKNSLYKEIAIQTIGFVNNELWDGQGFLSSIDADSDGMEGKYYTWTYNEIEEILHEDTPEFTGYFQITKNGNWENGRNILIRKVESLRTEDPTKKKFIKAASEKLLQRRSERIRPATDNKRITAWNAMMCEALIIAGDAIKNNKYILQAEKVLNFLLKNLLDKDHVLYRNYQKGKPATSGFLDDYAFLIHALIRLYQSTFRQEYLNHAQGLCDYVLKYFSGESETFLFYNNILFNQLISRPVETMDNVIPSSNAVMAENLYWLGVLLEDNGKLNKSKEMIKRVENLIQSSPAYFSFWLRLRMLLSKGTKEVVVMGKEYLKILNGFKTEFHPNCVFAGSEKEEYLPIMRGRYSDKHSFIYICENQTCKMPVFDIKEALPLMNP